MTSLQSKHHVPGVINPSQPHALLQRAGRGKEKPLIGWREWITFPDFGNIRVKAKIDTGAQTSAIHAWNIKMIRRNNTDMVSFDLHPIQRDNETVIACLAPLSDRRSVKSSGGHVTHRVFVNTQILLGERLWPIELSLTRRDDMGFRMLLGRAAVKGRYLVDPGKSFLLGK